MKHYSAIVYAVLSIIFLSYLTSCQDEDFGYTAEDVKKGAFYRNFESEYGIISPDQSWDLTRYMTRTSKYDDEALVDYLLQNGGQTRADGYYNPGGSQPLPESLTGIELDDEYYYHVQPNTIKWLRNYLKEGKNNTDLGSAFSLRAPNNKIAIIPIYQGFANMDWSLWIRHNGTDTQLWTESKNIKVSNDDGATWVDKGTTYGTSQTVYDHAIKSKPIIVDLGESTVKEFNLFLKIDDNNNQNNFATTGTVQLSSMGMMLALPCPIPSNLGQTDSKDNLAMIVGVEDSDLAESDWDMNDVCFLIVGFPELPNRIDITRKRYMCEDLGNTYDFDFNDIVVDVMEVQTSEYDAESNLFKPAGDPTQIATIKHVCGTLPFQVKVGETTFNTVTDPTDERQTLADLEKNVDPSKIVNLPTRAVNWNPEFSMKVEGWDHNENNVEVLVAVNSNTESLDVFTDAFGNKDGQVTVDGDNHIYHITFPTEPGDAPLIIATDPTLMWMGEHEHIPEAWWKEGTFKPTGSADNDTPADGGHGNDHSWADIPDHLVTPDADGNVVIWDAADHQNAENNPDKGIFEGWSGMQFQTELLDALFEGYNIIEFQFGDGNTAETFRLCKVANNWDTVIATPSISNSKATYTFSASALTDYNLGVAILNIGDSGKKMVLNKVIMRMPQTFTLTVDNVEHGTVTINPAANSDGKYAEGTQVTLTATPYDGWYFDQWSDGNTTNPRTITMSNDVTLSAEYTDQEPTYLWKGSLDNGNWDKNGEITLNFGNQTPTVGDKLTFTVNQQGNGFNVVFGGDWNNYKISANYNTTTGKYEITLTSGMIEKLNNNSNKVIINASNNTLMQVDLVASVKYDVTFTAGENGQIKVNNADATTSFSGQGVDGTSYTVQAIPNTGYKFANWSNGSTTNPGTFTVNGNDLTVSATFAVADSYSITASVVGTNGSVEISTAANAADGKYYEGTNVTITATPNDGYRVKEWKKDGNTISGQTGNTLNVTVGGADAAYTVEFEEKPAGPEEIDLSYSEKKLYLETIVNAGGNDDDKIVFYITNSSGESRNGWGIGEIQDMSWSKQGASWSGKEGSEWTYEYTVSQIKEFANGTTGIQYNIYNACYVTKITLVKQ